MNKSRPLYKPFALDLTGREHLVVTDQSEPPVTLDLTLSNISLWNVRTIAPGIQAPPAGRHRAFRAVPEMHAFLTHHLARASVGLRLYALGSEPFIWDTYNIGSAAGLTSAEMFLTQSGPPRRRVYCCHCKTMIGDVTQTIALCPGCGSSLQVRDHFSRRLAAFMGVKVDAEIPGDIPLPELLAS
ncbi:hypothetical protein GCM10010909_35070 [Acidocella aquatica]|uniref:Dimethylamine monooxygenase subunit DmmA-like C-terminal domain-containing protein n=1 Tax=Acidocella aquatica TaxID=1922313 RepID=A0ABQ6AFM7_9PROT|nr:dimethylamine monooxygenase subunit DmmA family protein [Acidocella aquatica]GLR68825.1 hypothetical protein GCM10010909_35070 [Acidocella aquatica]